MHNTLMFISSDIIAVSVSARTSAGLLSRGCFRGCFRAWSVSAGMISVMLSDWFRRSRWFSRNDLNPVPVVSAVRLQTSGGLLSDFPAVSVVCLPAGCSRAIDKLDWLWYNRVNIVS